jgi:hypothetical protein
MASLAPPRTPLAGGGAGPPRSRVLTLPNPAPIPDTNPVPNPVEPRAHHLVTALPSILDHVVQRDDARGHDGAAGAVPVCSILNHVVQTSYRATRGRGDQSRTQTSTAEPCRLVRGRPRRRRRGIVTFRSHTWPSSAYHFRL